MRLLAGFAVVAVTVAAFVYIGVYDVSAASRHLPPTQWLLSTAADRSIAARADDIDGPPSGTNIDREHGLVHYHEMCVACHGAPGIQPSEVGRGLNPTPPDFGDGTYSRRPGEVFWIIKNGIRMTGMPGFGPTHTDNEVWSMVVVLEELREVNAEEYLRRIREVGLQPMEGEHGMAPAAGHTDAPGSPAHSH